MATDGRNSKQYTFNSIDDQRKAKAERCAKASIAQRKNWARFRVNGAAGFTDGALRSAINRLQALRSEIPPNLPEEQSAITADIQELTCILRRVRDHRNHVMALIDEAEVM